MDGPQMPHNIQMQRTCQECHAADLSVSQTSEQLMKAPGGSDALP